MRSGNPEAAPPRRHLYAAVAISVALHTVLLLTVLRTGFASRTEVPRLEARPILVTLVRRQPDTAEASLAVPSDTPLDATSEASTDVFAELQPARETGTPMPDTVPESGGNPHDAVIAHAPQAVVTPATPATANDQQTQREAVTKAPELTPQALRAAVSTYLERQRGNATADWIAECEIQRKQHGTRNCDRLTEAAEHRSAAASSGREAAHATFAGVTRAARHALLTERFERNNVLMKKLIQVPGVQGSMAQDRYYLNREYIAYLNGNPSPYGAAYQFSCKQGPCIYEYTGFVVTKPPSPAAENEFRVVPARHVDARMAEVVPGLQ